MNNIIIIGTGGAVSEMMSLFDKIPVTGFLEYPENIEKYYKRYDNLQGCPILGTIDDYIPKEDDYFVLGMTHIDFRQKVVAKMKAKGAKFPNIIHPSCIVQSEIIGEGNIVGAWSLIGANVTLGNFNYLTPWCDIGHDCVVGDHNIFSATIVCGHCNIGDRNFFGIRTSLVPHIKVGNDSAVHAGVTVDVNIRNNELLTCNNSDRVLVRNYYRK
jgi:UDP-3-O-[3-hydroxymyristoyl] glucosamine N-acyltransferase